MTTHRRQRSEPLLRSPQVFPTAATELMPLPFRSPSRAPTQPIQVHHSIHFQYFAVNKSVETSVICSRGISRLRATAAALNSELVARVATWSSSICAAAGRKGQDPAAPGGSTTRASAYRTDYQSRSTTQSRRKPLSSRHISGAVLVVPRRANHHPGFDRAEHRADVGVLVRLSDPVCHAGWL